MRAAAHVDRSFLDRVGLPARDPVDEASEPWWDSAYRDRYRHVCSPLVMQIVTVGERLSAMRHMSFADPWSDRRVAEFVLACPQHQITGVRESKRIMRRAIVGIMPPLALAAARKVPPAPLYYVALRERSRETVLELISASRVADLGFIDADTLLRDYEAFVAGARSEFDIWSTLSLEMWLRRYWF